MKNIPRHLFNVEHTSNTQNHAIDNLSEAAIFKVQDLSKNYTCLLPKDIMSIHWTKKQVTMFLPLSLFIR